MHLTLPETWEISVNMLVSAAMALLLAAWTARAAYARIMHAIADLKAAVDALKQRNAMADAEAAAMLQRHSENEKQTAVIAAQITAFGNSLARIDRNLERLAQVNQ